MRYEYFGKYTKRASAGFVSCGRTFFSLFFYYLAVRLTVFPRRFYNRKDKSSLFYQSALLEQKLNICALNFLKHKLECFLFGK